MPNRALSSSGILHRLLLLFFNSQIRQKIVHIQSSYILRKPQKFEEISKLVFNLLSNVKKSLEISSNLGTVFMILLKKSLFKSAKIRMLLEKSFSLIVSKLASFPVWSQFTRTRHTCNVRPFVPQFCKSYSIFLI